MVGFKMSDDRVFAGNLSGKVLVDTHDVTDKFFKGCAKLLNEVNFNDLPKSLKTAMLNSLSSIDGNVVEVDDEMYIVDCSHNKRSCNEKQFKKDYDKVQYHFGVVLKSKKGDDIRILEKTFDYMDKEQFETACKGAMDNYTMYENADAFFLDAMIDGKAAGVCWYHKVKSKKTYCKGKDSIRKM